MKSCEISILLKSHMFVRFYTFQEKQNFTELFEGLHFKQHIKRMQKWQKSCKYNANICIHTELQLDESKI